MVYMSSYVGAVAHGADGLLDAIPRHAVLSDLAGCKSGIDRCVP